MHPFEVWVPTCCVAYGLLTQKCIYLVCSRLNVETRPERPIDIKVWQKVRENLVFCRVCCCISRLDNRCSPQHFGIKKSVMLFFFLSGCTVKSKLLCKVSADTCCWMLKTHQFPPIIWTNAYFSFLISKS